MTTSADTSVTFPDHLSAVDEIAALFTAGGHWILVPTDAAALAGMGRLNLDRHRGTLVWLHTGGAPILRCTGPMAVATSAAVPGMFGIPAAWIAAVPKTSTGIADLIGHVCGGSTVEGADDVLLLQERDSPEQGLPALWLDVLQRVDHDQAEELRAHLVPPTRA